MDFDLIDDVLPERDAFNEKELKAVLVSRPALRIGPLVEYAYLQAQDLGALPSLEDLPSSAVLLAFCRARAWKHFSNVPVDTSIQARGREFCWVPATPEAFGCPCWKAFRKRFQDAAERSGFPKTTAQGLTGACDEMATNVFEHSTACDTGMVGYRWTKGEFEYLVADAGEGVLSSLRRHPDYQDVEDAGTALKTALTDGESRFGRESTRGYGFHSVFRSLLGLGGALRFRSGDQRLEIEGVSPVLGTATLAQTAFYQGFLVSVLCRSFLHQAVG
jgi:anti-sigma regulatory factor (Ser/Thr protein kinase)